MDNDLKHLNTFIRIISVILILGSIKIFSELFTEQYAWYEMTSCIGRAFLTLLIGIFLIRTKFH